MSFIYIYTYSAIIAIKVVLGIIHLATKAQRKGQIYKHHVPGILSHGQPWIFLSELSPNMFFINLTIYQPHSFSICSSTA